MFQASNNDKQGLYTCSCDIRIKCKGANHGKEVEGKEVEGKEKIQQGSAPARKKKTAKKSAKKAARLTPASYLQKIEDFRQLVSAGGANVNVGAIVDLFVPDAPSPPGPATVGLYTRRSKSPNRSLVFRADTHHQLVYGAKSVVSRLGAHLSESEATCGWKHCSRRSIPRYRSAKRGLASSRSAPLATYFHYCARAARQAAWFP